MKEQTSATNNSVKIEPYLSPLAVWALSVGSAIGWGSLVVTSSSYLSQAGPVGSIIGLLCMKSKKATARIMVAMVLIFTIGITLCFAVAMIGHGSTGMTMSPSFLPQTGALRQVLRIAFISPWAFIGFESVSHSASEYKFKHSNMFRVLVISVAVTTALYVFVVLLSISAYPEGCVSWLDYTAGALCRPECQADSCQCHTSGAPYLSSNTLFWKNGNRLDRRYHYNRSHHHLRFCIHSCI